MKRLNQELYDLLGDSIVYILGYSRKHDILLPNKDALKRMSDRIHDIMIQIDEPDESLQQDNYDSSDGDDTEPYKWFCKLCVGLTHSKSL